MTVTSNIVIIGGGLAGTEAAFQLADRNIPVTLYDMKPTRRSPAHHSNDLAEIVCSNSFGSQGPTTASGLLKLEMETLGCKLLQIAQSVSVPAGKALAVDRDAFAREVTRQIMAHPYITFKDEELSEFPEAEFTILATGPMTTPALTQHLSELLKRDQLYFFDAASPIVVKDSIDFNIAFYQDRYGNEKDPKDPQDTEDQRSNQTAGENRSYINCPLDKPQYEALIQKILAAEKTPLKSFEETEAQKTKFFESCLPVEVIASRGTNTLRFGPMKPVGIEDPRTGRWPYAVVQLRQDNAEGTLYNIVGFQTNIKWGEQKEMIQLIPGLENAEVVRYGVMHRNTFIHSPEVLQPTLQLKEHPHILVAGQLTGTEGYTESIATGMMAAINISRLIQEKSALSLPNNTMLGALLHYITREEAIGKNFQPINSNWGLMPELKDIGGQLKKKKDRPARNAAYVKRALQSLHQLNCEEHLSMEAPETPPLLYLELAADAPVAAPSI
ncbi:MAG: methylenetetrahydrofolate--tRNA-(uracil(54)-C(5))-methyltransferase (FADH(2)-oxidizing) TrmFO [Vampirovibrio sp.]|nr:methylenetetrahydrofolate--tRNA-(uracil(54)-C(5))-methyltransferase (FADH(2)-oxidizing) TrmFO [Vampirovibrio sp.]